MSSDAAERMAALGATAVDGVDVLGSLSPSRASDFMSCPLLFRFRTVDRLPEPSSPEAVRGTLVHKVLEDLFDLPAAERTPEHAAALLAPAWEKMQEQEPDVAAMFGGEGAPEVASWLAACHEFVRRYFDLEDPTRIEPAERETYVETLLDSKLLLRGFVDRLDVAPTGEVRVVDYKTGKAPPADFEARALFQMRFYALVVWRSRGVLPAVLQLVYLGSGEVLRYSPDEQDLLATQRKVEALWAAISTARESGDWQPSPGRQCDWCAHRAICPAFGGTPPPLPTRPVLPVLTVSADESPADPHAPAAIADEVDADVPTVDGLRGRVGAAAGHVRGVWTRTRWSRRHPR